MPVTLAAQNIQLSCWSPLGRENAVVVLRARCVLPKPDAGRPPDPSYTPSRRDWAGAVRKQSRQLMSCKALPAQICVACVGETRGCFQSVTWPAVQSRNGNRRGFGEPARGLAGRGQVVSAPRNALCLWGGTGHFSS